MLPFLAWIPVGTSLVLGVVFLVSTEGQPLPKIIGIAIFALAVYLQFFSRLTLAGLLLQIALALSLALWRRVSTV